MPEDFHLFAIILILLGALCFLSLKLGKSNMDKEELKLRVKTLQLIVHLNKIAPTNTVVVKPQLSETAEKLLALAAKNNNPHEAAVAAVQACKRIHKELGYK